MPIDAPPSTPPPDTGQEEAARETARILLDIHAVDARPEAPFRLTSGRTSPVYIDCRRIISFPEARSRITEMAVSLIEREIGFANLDAVAGGETAGIPFAAWIAERAALPMLYVRKKAKKFGRMAQIEGDMREGERVLLVEDLATDGGSKIHFCNALGKAGALVEHAFVVFHYGIFPQSVEALAAIGVRLHALATWWDVLAVAGESGRFDAETLAEVRAFLEDPEAWSRAHGGKVR